MSKTSKVADKGSKASKALNKVKDAGVTKASSSPAAKSKTIAAKVASKEKSSKKSKKEPTPSSSESESESDEDMKDASSSSSESESEDEKPAPKKAEKKVAAKKAESSDSSDSSDSESESEEEKPAPKKAEKKVVAKKAESSDSSDSSDSESEEEKPAPKKAAAKAESSDSSDSDSSESEAEAKKAESSDSDSDSDSDSEASEPSKKRKADDEPEAVAKKSKTEEVPEGASANLFIGNLSWNVDEEWLQREFSEFGELSGCRIVTDRESGRSRGFGYVEFVNAPDAVKAMDAKKGTDLDGRTINLDYATARAAPQAGADRTQNRARSYGDSTSPESDTLFVGNLPFSATEDALHEVFGAQGSVLGIRLPTEQETGRPKGFGYVQFASIDEAKAAHSALNGEEIEGRAIRLDFSTPRPPRENGGGFGGGRGGGGRGGGRGGFGGRGGGGGGFGGRGGGGRGGGRGGFGAPRGGALNKGKGSIPEFKGSKVTF